jgi:hypothetical protein
LGRTSTFQGIHCIFRRGASTFAASPTSHDFGFPLSFQQVEKEGYHHWYGEFHAVGLPEFCPKDDDNSITAGVGDFTRPLALFSSFRPNDDISCYRTLFLPGLW